MGRRQSIDRDHVLDVAEAVVGRGGASALTIDAVAKAAGITKGGVQSCFGTKEALVAAMLQRWMQGYEARFAAVAGDGANPIARIAAHVVVTRDDDEDMQARSASLLALLLQTPDHLAGLRRWYEDRLAGLNPSTEAGRLARLAFLATEGAFFLRFFGLADIGPAEWLAVFADIVALIEPAGQP